jgi:hypothetical protein
MDRTSATSRCEAMRTAGAPDRHAISIAGDDDLWTIVCFTAANTGLQGQVAGGLLRHRQDRLRRRLANIARSPWSGATIGTSQETCHQQLRSLSCGGDEACTRVPFPWAGRAHLKQACPAGLSCDGCAETLAVEVVNPDVDDVADAGGS